MSKLGIEKGIIKVIDGELYYKSHYCYWLYTQLEEMQTRIDKAIEHLYKRNEQNKSALTNKEQTIISKHELLKLEIFNNEILENILRGEDNENIRTN